MKIAMVAPAFPYRGGIAHFGVRLARQMAERHQILYLNFSRLYPELLFPGKTQFDNSGTPIDFPTDRIVDSMWPLSWNKAGKNIKNWGADVLVYHWWHPFFGACYKGIGSSAGRNMKKIAICHNVAPHDSGAFHKHWVSIGLRNIDGFVVHSDSEVQELDGLFPGNAHLKLFHPLYDIFPLQDMPKDEARRTLNLKDSDRVVLYFGLIRPYKGVEVLLKAAKKVLDIERLKIFIVGEIYSGRSVIRDLMRDLPKETVHLVDKYLPNEEVAVWFRASDLLALPYINATQSGIVPIAYQCQRPVIVTRVGGLPDVVMDGESGYLIEPNNPVQLANAIRSHFIDHGNPSMTEGINAMRDRLSWDRYADQLEMFVNSI